MWTALLLVVGLVSPVPQAPHDPLGDADESAIPALVRPDDPDFDALNNAYVGQLRDYDQLRLKIARKELDPSKLPPHPAIAWSKKFQALSHQGSGAALAWILSNLAWATEDDAERTRIVDDVFDRLLARHSEEPALLDAVSSLRSLVDSIGEPRAIELCKQVAERSEHPEIDARALMTHAWILMKLHRGDPAKLAEAIEIERELVFAYAGTEAAKEATNALVPIVESELLDAERAWISAVETLQASGAPIEGWPAQPMHAFQTRFLPLAAAGNKQAKKWVDHLYPAYSQAAHQGTAQSLSWLSGALGTHYGFDPAGWTGVRIAMLRILFRQHPEEPWVIGVLETLKREAEALPVEMLADAVAPLLEKSTSKEVRALATFLVAQAHRGAGDQASSERALALYQRVIDGLPGEGDHGIAYEAASLKADLERVMPGAPAPGFFGKDAEAQEFSLADYAGRVVVLEFWSLRGTVGLKAEDGAARNALVTRMKQRPFSWIGANVDPMTQRNYYEQSAKVKVAWRSALLQSMSEQHVSMWGVRKVPTTYLIDAEGRIRARNMPWDEQTALIETLVVEAEAKAKREAEAKAK